MYWLEASVCRENSESKWTPFIQIGEDKELISSLTFDAPEDLDKTYNEMCAYFLTHTPEVVSGLVKEYTVRNELRDAVWRAFQLNREVS